MKRDVLIYWFSQPPKVERGAYNEVSKKWDNTVYYISYEDWGADRKKLKWDDNNFGKAIFISLASENNKELFVKQILDNNPEAINIIPGFTSPISKIVLEYAKNKKIKLCVVTERPVPFYSKTGTLFRVLRYFYKKAKYSYIYFETRDLVDAVMPLGKLGVDEYNRVGWPKNRLFPFMYCPELKMYEPRLKEKNEDIIKFLYVGRFMYSTKGIDYIQKAIKGIRYDNWMLDMAGGYGKDKDEILKWIKTQKHVNYVGSWDSNKVIENIRNYDCVIVPSKGEGWNMIVHESIAASVGVIVTNLAVSDELIASSHAGIVIRAFSVRALRKAMENVIHNPSLINEWKCNAHDYQNLVQPSVVAEYFIKIMDNIYYHGNEPACPWQV